MISRKVDFTAGMVGLLFLGIGLSVASGVLYLGWVLVLALIGFLNQSAI